MAREPDFVAVTVRRLKPGAYDAWRKAWHDPEDPDSLGPDQESKAYIARNVDDPDEIVAFGFFHGKARTLSLSAPIRRSRAGRRSVPPGWRRTSTRPSLTEATRCSRSSRETPPFRGDSSGL